MGPIPLPIKLPGVDTTVRWYAAVRSTELRGVEALAADLNARGGTTFVRAPRFSLGGEQCVSDRRARR